RRASSFSSENEVDVSLTDLMRMEAEDVKEMYPELLASMPEAEKILEVEARRFGESKEKARRIVSEMVRKEEKFDTKKMIQLYESNGITPELVEKVADEMKKDIRIPTDFYSKVTQKKFEKEEEKIPINTEGMPATKLLYYENKLECTSNVLEIHDLYVILDKTVFYPESGGQARDAGKINGETVAAVEKVGEVIVHVMAGKPKFRKNESVKCSVIGGRREALRRHHSATHVVNAAARRVLGNHVWQAGARKEPERAHLDITHYEKISPEQLREIETVANRIVLENHPVTTTVMDRGEAEKKYGFTLYQGGGSPGKKIRVVDIAGIDAEACGGLHVTNTGQIGMIKIISESRIQDGINRLEFCAGEAAVKYVQEMQERMAKTAEALRVPADQVEKTASRFFEEWKERGKKVETLSGELAKMKAQSLLCSEEEVVRAVLDVDASTLKTLAQEFSKKGKAAVLANNENNVFCIGDGKHKANGLLAEIVKKFGGAGGGSDKFAAGKTERKVVF
ncbi:MAG: alanine--tRNA ligase-related protein, partial [Candidatus Micrarchaeota archaeon]|nr:alanine--tRNA ligase-related protein [Candidatus Micrarchaeota archaeon]